MPDTEFMLMLKFGTRKGAVRAWMQRVAKNNKHEFTDEERKLIVKWWSRLNHWREHDE